MPWLKDGYVCMHMHALARLLQLFVEFMFVIRKFSGWTVGG